MPVYREFHEWLGRGEDLKGMWDNWAAGDRRGALAALPRKTMDELIIQGDIDERRAHVQRYMDAGVDTAFLSLFSFNPDPAVRRELIMTATREMAPR